MATLPGLVLQKVVEALLMSVMNVDAVVALSLPMTLRCDDVAMCYGNAKAHKKPIRREQNERRKKKLLTHVYA